MNGVVILTGRLTTDAAASDLADRAWLLGQIHVVYREMFWDNPPFFVLENREMLFPPFFVPKESPSEIGCSRQHRRSLQPGLRVARIHNTPIATLSDPKSSTQSVPSSGCFPIFSNPF